MGERRKEEKKLGKQSKTKKSCHNRVKNNSHKLLEKTGTVPSFRLCSTRVETEDWKKLLSELNKERVCEGE